MRVERSKVESSRRVVLLAGLAAIALATPSLQAESRYELRFAGILGNSGDSAAALVTFEGRLAAGMGPVLDDANTLWERGGSRQLNRYALDGRLLASFELPDSHDRSDQLVHAGDHLVMKLRKTLYALPLSAPPRRKAAAFTG